MADENVNVTTQQEGNAAAFYDTWGLSDEDKGYIQSAKYSDASAIIKALRDTKAYVGADKNDLIRIPKADKDGNRDLSEVYKALGKPEKAEDYGLGDNDFAKAAADKLFELGLNSKQAKALADFMAEQDAIIQKNTDEEWNANVNKGVEALKKEWGADYEVNSQLAQKAVREIVEATGLTEEELNKIEKTLGTDKSMKLFYSIGAKEGGVKNLTNYIAGQETPEIAAYKIAELKKDRDFVKKLANNDASAITEMKRLTELAMKK